MLYNSQLVCLVDPSWPASSRSGPVLNTSQSPYSRSRDHYYTTDELLHMEACSDQHFRPVDHARHSSTGTLQRSQHSLILPEQMFSEVTIDDLQELYREHCLNARLVLQALTRKLHFLREDRCLPFGASTSSTTPISELAYLQSLKHDEDVLNHISNCYFEVDRRRHAVFEDEFYVGFWDAWCDIRDIGRHRRPYQRYMDSIAIIEKARLDLYFPHLHHSVSALIGSYDTSYFPSYLGTKVTSQMSLNQTNLYSHATPGHRDAIEKPNPYATVHKSRCAPTVRPVYAQPVVKDEIDTQGDLGRLQCTSAEQGHVRYKWEPKSNSGQRDNTESSRSLYTGSGAGTSSIDQSSMDFACRGLASSLSPFAMINRTEAPFVYKVMTVVNGSTQSHDAVGRHSMRASRKASVPIRNPNDKSVNDTCESIIERYSYWPTDSETNRSSLESLEVLQYSGSSQSPVELSDRRRAPAMVKLRTSQAHKLHNSRKNVYQRESFNTPLRLLSSNIFDPAECKLSVRIKARDAKVAQLGGSSTSCSLAKQYSPDYLQKSIGSGHHISTVMAGRIRFALD